MRQIAGAACAVALSLTAAVAYAQMLPPNQVATATHSDGRELTLLYSEVARTCPGGWNVVQESRTHQQIGCWKFTLAGGVDILWDNGKRTIYPREWFTDTPQYRLWREQQTKQKDATDPAKPDDAGLTIDMRDRRD